MELVKISKTSSDETSCFEVFGFHSVFVRDFIFEVLNDYEWGYFSIVGSSCRVEYRNGVLLNDIPLSWNYIMISRVFCSGGYTRFDYSIVRL